MSVAPDIRVDEVQIGGVSGPVRSYFIARCMRCRAQLEPEPSRALADRAGEMHLTATPCLAFSGGGHEVPGASAG